MIWTDDMSKVDCIDGKRMLCLECGNTESFIRVVTQIEEVSETILLDGDYEYVKTLNRSLIEVEVQDDPVHSCRECKSEQIVFLTPIQLAEKRWMKTFKDSGEWVFACNVPEHLRDPKLAQEYITIKLANEDA